MQSALRKSVQACCLVLFAAAALHTGNDTLPASQVLSQLQEHIPALSLRLIRSVCVAQLAAVAAITAQHGTSHTTAQRSSIFAALQHAGDMLVTMLSSKRTTADNAGADAQLAHLFVRLASLHVFQPELTAPDAFIDTVLEVVEACPHLALTLPLAEGLQQLAPAREDHRLRELVAALKPAVRKLQDEDMAALIHTLGISVAPACRSMN